ncbi:MAG: hypothetical protein ACFFAN_19910 [Promethearchaeota archaeon]
MRIELEKKGKHTDWRVIYHIDRLKQNTSIELHPLLIFIHDSYITDRIQFKVTYTHVEIGIIKA